MVFPLAPSKGAGIPQSKSRVIERLGKPSFKKFNEAVEIDEYFEWVLGPGERFVSEAVFHFAFSGPVYETISGVSSPLDRTVERAFGRFLEKHIGIAGRHGEIPVPMFLVQFRPQCNGRGCSRSGSSGCAGWIRMSGTR